MKVKKELRPLYSITKATKTSQKEKKKLTYYESRAVHRLSIYPVSTYRCRRSGFPDSFRISVYIISSAVLVCK